MATDPVQHPILFFDGVCGLCNRVVDRLLRADRRGVLRFAPLQGKTARRLLPDPPADPAGWSVVLRDADGVHQQSAAALRVCRHVGGWYRLLLPLRLIPRALRDPVYRWIARNRYRWFGRRDACRLPSPAERERFLP